MSQFGEIEDINLARDEDTGKSRGFAFVKYEDARSCILAVDNLVGIKVRALTVGGVVFLPERIGISKTVGPALSLSCTTIVFYNIVMRPVLAGGSHGKVSLAQKVIGTRRGQGSQEFWSRSCLPGYGIGQQVFHASRTRFVFARCCQ
mmetsp:Transcript_16880/g.41125  ORF Transcript_16880/g.41125 Transcript_16880/m.41125 type:complete len:147 (+) Transcript_16880:182-622(+)